MKLLIFFLLLCSSFVSANGWLENRSYQFTSTDARYLFILQAQQKAYSKAGGYSNTFNVTYNGENMQVGDIYNADTQSFSTSNAIGNLSTTTITGDNNSVNTGQDNDQGSNSSTIVGQDLNPWVGGVGTTIGGTP